MVKDLSNSRSFCIYFSDTSWPDAEMPKGLVDDVTKYLKFGESKSGLVEG